MRDREGGAPPPPPPTSRAELLGRARALTGHTVGEVAAAVGMALPPASRHGKGFAGQVAERALGADPCAGFRPDFPDLGVELKTIPLGAGGVAAESTFCCGVEMGAAAEAEWATSRLRRRLACVLWLPLTAARLAPLAARRFGRPRLWSPSEAEEATLRADWEELMGAIGAGLAGRLCARRGEALQVRPKAAHSQIRTLAPGADGGMEASLPLGFYLRARFTQGVLAGRYV